MSDEPKADAAEAGRDAAHDTIREAAASGNRVAKKMARNIARDQRRGKS